MRDFVVLQSGWIGTKMTSISCSWRGGPSATLGDGKYDFLSPYNPLDCNMSFFFANLQPIFFNTRMYIYSGVWSYFTVDTLLFIFSAVSFFKIICQIPS